MSFSSLKKNRKQEFEKLNSELSKLNSNPYQDPEQDSYWKPTLDKAGNGYAIIRFLPAPEGEDVPFVRIWDHFFKGPTGKIYAEKSRTSIGDQNDPVYELTGKLWNTGIEADKETARKYGRNLGFHSNIYVVEDSGNPENNGKVFRYRYGKKIFDKLNDAMNPQFPDDPRLNPFDLWEGANLKLKIRKVDGWPNYDKSEFETPGPLFEDDDKLEAIYKKEYPLQTLIDPSKFKSYEELKKKLDEVLGSSEQGVHTARRVTEDDTPYVEPKQQVAKSLPEKELASEPELAPDEDEEDFDFSKFLEDE